MAVFDGSARRQPALYIATVEKSEGQVAVSRLAFGLAPPQTFTSDSALSSASLTPPAPFSGKAPTSRPAAADKSWTGSLAVSFPGAENLPLTGPQFTTQLARSW